MLQSGTGGRIGGAHLDFGRCSVVTTDAKGDRHSDNGPVTHHPLRCATIRLQVASDPVCGDLIADGLAPRPFQGWLELIRALDALREGPPADEHDTA